MSNNELYEYSSTNDSNCSIVGLLDSSQTILDLPSISPEGKTVTKIAARAFKGNTTIEEVIIPDSIKSIGDSSFEDCSNLHKLVLPEKMRDIGNKAFKRCNLESIVLPKTGYIDYAAFSKNECATIYLNQPIGVIKSHAFNGCIKIICAVDISIQNQWDKNWSAGVGTVEFVSSSELLLDKTSDDGNPSIKTADITENRKKIIPSKQNDGTSSGIYYTKSKKLTLSVKGLTFTNIPVLKSVRLSFYEKFTVLLLQKGIKASAIDELVDFISVMLNVSKKCIAEFIDYLDTNDYLTVDSKQHVYKMDTSIHFTLDKAYDNAMFAELDIKLADCDKIVFVDKLNSLYLDEDFSKDVFTRKGNATSTSNTPLPSKVAEIVYNSKSLLEPLFVRYFSKTNMHLKRDFSYELLEDSFLDFQFEFDALIEYKYIKEQKKAIRQNILVLNNNMLPEQFIDSLADKYNTDTTLPKFIALDEDFYQKITPSTDSFTDIETAIDTAKSNAAPLQQEVAEEKAQLSTLKKEHAKAKKIETDKADQIRSEIEDREGEISMNEDLISSSEDPELIKNLKRTIKDLKSEKSALVSQLSDSQKSIYALTESHRQAENALNSTIKSKEAELKKYNDSIKEYEGRQKEVAADYKSLIEKNVKKLSSVVKIVIEKYPAPNNLFFRYVSDICLMLDSAVSASEYLSFDEVGYCLDGIREKYRKALQAVFEVMLKKNIKTLGTYLSDPFNQIAIQDKFKEKKISIDTLNKLISFHGLANAIGHSTENGPQKKENEQRVANFKKQSVDERSKILLAIPTFFSKIEFSKMEIDLIVAKLKV